MAEYDKILKSIYVQAKLAGACNKFRGNETLPELIKLFKSPQGIEFCLANHYPNMATLRLLKQFDDLTKYGIYIDAGDIVLSEPAYVVCIGRTYATINISSSEILHKVVVMHGARCMVNASGWSVVKTELETGSFIIKNCSDNAMIL